MFELDSDTHMTILARLAALVTLAVLATGSSALGIAVFDDQAQVSAVDIAPPRIVSSVEGN